MSTSDHSNEISSQPGTVPLQSTLSSDPDMAELVQFFVEEMADRVDTIRTAAEENDLAQLRVVAHQLKGAATGYGFEPISSSAASLEKLIDGADPTAQVESVRSQVDELINLCTRVSV